MRTRYDEVIASTSTMSDHPPSDHPSGTTGRKTPSLPHTNEGQPHLPDRRSNSSLGHRQESFRRQLSMKNKPIIMNDGSKPIHNGVPTFSGKLPSDSPVPPIRQNGASIKIIRPLPEGESILRRLELQAIQDQAEAEAISHIDERRREAFTQFYAEPANKYKTMPTRRRSPKKDSPEHPHRSNSLFGNTIRRLKEAVFGKSKSKSKTKRSDEYKVKTPLPDPPSPPPRPQPNKLPRSFSLPRSLGFSRKSVRKEEVRIPASRSTEFPSREHNHPSLHRADTPASIHIKDFEPSLASLILKDQSMSPLQRGFPNYGNTCYWNAVIQCLGAMEPIAKYFIEMEFKKVLDVSRSRAEANTYEMSMLFAKLMDAMWRNQDGSEYVRRMRCVLGRHHSEFARAQQQDAQELLLVLIRMLSKDMPGLETRITPTADDGIFCKTMAASVSECVQCSSCHISSRLVSHHTPLLCLALPSIEQLVLEYTEIRSMSPFGRVVKRATSTNPKVKVRGVALLISRETNINKGNLLLFQTNYTSFAHCLVTSHDLVRKRNPADGDGFHVTELYPPSLGLDRIEIVTCVFVHSMKGPSGLKRMTEPFTCRLCLSATYSEVVQALFAASQPVVRASATEKPYEVYQHFRITLHDDNSDASGPALRCGSERPLMELNAQRTMDEQTRLLPELPRFLRLVIEWRSPPLTLFNPSNDSIVSSPSYDSLISQLSYPTMHNLMAKHFAPEFLADWRCESCFKVGGVKTTGYYPQPRIMMVMFKRFVREHPRRDHFTKITTPVTFPLDRFDTSQFCDSNTRLLPEERNLLVYDVVAIVCHTGSLAQGHYIAFTRNPVTDQWRKFDDQITFPVAASEVDISNAYMVFMQKRSDRLVKMELGVKFREPSFFSSIRNGKWGGKENRENREILYQIPNGPLVNGRDMKRSSSFRRDDATRRPTSVASNSRIALPYSSSKQQPKEDKATDNKVGGVPENSQNADPSEGSGVPEKKKETAL